MKTKLLIVLSLVALPGLAIAQTGTTYQCTHGELQRRIEVLFETGMTLPCEVHYYKDTEAPGESQVLWRAANEGGYCESKARGLVDKLQGLGWDCGLGETEPATPAEPAAPAGAEDDTDELEPAADAASTE